jgi:DNA-binding transcriptional LysR family regulator
MIDDITFVQINAFHAVARTLSFSRAAEQLFRTQSAVSIQVAKLEEAVGHTLFQRTTKHIELTEAGAVFLRCAIGIRNLLEQTSQEMDDLKQMAHGRLTLCTSDTTACYRLPGIIQAYQKHYPGIDIIVRNATSLKTIEMVTNGQVDLGIATFKYLNPALASVPLFQRRDVVICHPDHDLAGRDAAFLKDLEAYTAILLDRNCASRRILDEACQQAGVNLKISMELSSIEVVKNFVSINSGISIVPAVSVRKECSEGRLVSVTILDFDELPPVRMGAIYRKNHYLSLASRSFLKLLQKTR